jgi:hypothetical protein
MNRGESVAVSDINTIADDLIIAVGIAVLIIRQFLWRSADLARMLRMPVVVIGAGIVYLRVELRHGFVWSATEWLVLAELVLVAITGTIMGHVTRFRRVEGGVQYRLTRPGVLLWAAFVAIRVGGFALAHLLGARLLETTGMILVSFGANRLAASLVVRRRADTLITPSPEQTTTPS